MKTIPQTLVTQAVSFAVHNPHSDFYRRKYGAEFARLKEKNLIELPFLTRAEIDAVPVLERTFVPREIVRFIRSTSGSSGKSVIGFPMLEEGLLRQHLQDIGYVPVAGQNSRYFEPYFSQMGITSMLLFSAGAFVHETRVRLIEGRDVISGEFAQPEETARLAFEAQADAMVGNPSGLVDFAPHLSALDATTMRLIISVGERPTKAQFAALAHYFPNAEIALQYGLTESQGYVGYTCPHLLTRDPKALHLAEGTLFMELIDPETLESLPLLPGSEGEVVITTHEPQGFPLIRYRTGDLARIREESCACEGSPLLFECMGRLGLDRMRVPRGVLTVAAIEQALLSLPFPVIEFEGTWVVEERLPYLQLTCIVADEYLSGKVPTDALAAALFVSQEVAYKDLVTQGLALPVELTLAPKERWIGWKKKRRLS